MRLVWKDRGLSRRHAVRVLNLIFTEMQQAQKRGHSVEFPLGKLLRVRRLVQTDRPANRQGSPLEQQPDSSCNGESGSWLEPAGGPETAVSAERIFGVLLESGYTSAGLWGRKCGHKYQSMGWGTVYPTLFRSIFCTELSGSFSASPSESNHI